MPNDTLYATGVSVTFTLYSANSPAPFNIAGCDGQVNFSDGSSQQFPNWAAANLGTPEPNGASLAVTVADSSYSSSGNVTGVGNWAITFIPRGANATSQSPVGNNQSTITGTGATNNNGQFALPLSNVSIKNSGDFDWMLMVQMIMSDGVTIKCFASDPEMEVGA